MLIGIKISRNSAFLGSDRLIMLFFLLLNVKMPTLVGILTFMNRKKNVGILTFMSGKIPCSAEVSMKTVFLSGPGLQA